MRLLRPLAAGALLAAVLFSVPATAPDPAAGVGPIPACRLDDILTEPRGYDDWSTTLVDWILTVGPDYKPPDLVSVQKAGIAGGGYVRKVAIDDLRALADAARKHGTPIAVFSPYRSYKQQVELFGIYDRAYDTAVNFSQRPGHSEHTLGLAIDFITKGAKGMSSSWEQQPAGKWMAAHAWEYGWVMSYPKDTFDRVCFNYEPWHYRYLGREMAKKVHDSGLTIREYLWANVTQVDPACVALPAPKLVTPGVPRSCAFAAASASPGASPTAEPASSALPGASVPLETALVSPSPSSLPASQASAFFGLGPVAAIGGFVLLGLAAVGLVAWWRTRSRRRRVRY